MRAYIVLVIISLVIVGSLITNAYTYMYWYVTVQDHKVYLGPVVYVSGFPDFEEEARRIQNMPCEYLVNTDNIVINEPGVYCLESDVVNLTINSSNVVIKGNGHHVESKAFITLRENNRVLENITIVDTVLNVDKLIYIEGQLPGGTFPVIRNITLIHVVIEGNNTLQARNYGVIEYVFFYNATMNVSVPIFSDSNGIIRSIYIQESFIDSNYFVKGASTTNTVKGLYVVSSILNATSVFYLPPGTTVSSILFVNDTVNSNYFVNAQGGTLNDAAIIASRIEVRNDLVLARSTINGLLFVLDNVATNGYIVYGFTSPVNITFIASNISYTGTLYSRYCINAVFYGNFYEQYSCNDSDNDGVCDSPWSASYYSRTGRCTYQDNYTRAKGVVDDNVLWSVHEAFGIINPYTVNVYQDITSIPELTVEINDWLSREVYVFTADVTTIIPSYYGFIGLAKNRIAIYSPVKINSIEVNDNSVVIGLSDKAIISLAFTDNTITKIVVKTNTRTTLCSTPDECNTLRSNDNLILIDPATITVYLTNFANTQTPTLTLGGRAIQYDSFTIIATILIIACTVLTLRIMWKTMTQRF